MNKDRVFSYQNHVLIQEGHAWYWKVATDFIKKKIWNISSFSDSVWVAFLAEV